MILLTLTTFFFDFLSFPQSHLNNSKFPTQLTLHFCRNRVPETRNDAPNNPRPRPRGDRRGALEAILDKIAVALGGRAAEELFVKRITTGASDDLDKVGDGGARGCGVVMYWQDWNDKLNKKHVWVDLWMGYWLPFAGGGSYCRKMDFIWWDTADQPDHSPVPLVVKAMLLRCEGTTPGEWWELLRGNTFWRLNV